MLSKEGKTAQRLYGQHSQDHPEKRVIQTAALMKLFISTHENWKVTEVKDIIILG
jgi:hypothetical protein